MLQGSQSEEQKQNIYTRFYIAGRDIAAFFTDCGSDSQKFSLVAPIDNHQEIDSTLEKVDDFYSLIDRCGMAVIVDQVLFQVILILILYVTVHCYGSLIYLSMFVAMRSNNVYASVN